MNKYQKSYTLSRDQAAEVEKKLSKARKALKDISHILFESEINFGDLFESELTEKDGQDSN